MVAYKTLLIHLAVGRSNTQLLLVAEEISTILGARIVGIAACQPMPVVFADGMTAGTLLAACEDELDTELHAAEAEFREMLKGSGQPLEWRAANTTDALSDYLAAEARCADLIISGTAPTAMFDMVRHANVGDLVVRAGRPVLIVPQSGAKPPFGTVAIAWKDTREARRAAVDALPLLALAKQVLVLAIAEKNDIANAQRGAEDVVQWLSRHGIAATPVVKASQGDDAADLEEMFKLQDCDLVVAGAFGHNRLQEWVFGSVTQSMLKTARCAFLSH